MLCAITKIALWFFSNLKEYDRSDSLPFWLWKMKKSFWCIIERKNDTTIIFLSIWKESQIYFRAACPQISRYDRRATAVLGKTVSRRRLSHTRLCLQFFSIEFHRPNWGTLLKPLDTIVQWCSRGSQMFPHDDDRHQPLEQLYAWSL